MPQPRGKRTKLTVDRGTFEEYFFVGSTGINVARDAMAADKIRTPYEAIELVCLVNQLEAEWFFWDMVAELEPHGKDDDYIAAHKLGDFDRYDRLIFDNVSKDRVYQMLLDVQSDVREELGIPEGRRRLKRVPSLTQSEPDDEDREKPREKLAPEMKGEPAVVPMLARSRFEQFFDLDSPAYSIVWDAQRQNVIATPYEAVKMLCEANMMYATRIRANMWRTAFGQYDTPEELDAAVQNRTFAATAASSWNERFDQIYDDLILEIRTAFGVPKTEERGKGEKYRLWLQTRSKPVN
jgi:hypothetical protein